MNIEFTLVDLANALLARSRRYGFVLDATASGAMIRCTRHADDSVTCEWVGPEDGLVPITYNIDYLMPNTPWLLEMVARDDAQEIAWYRRVAPQEAAS
jgi:hypothetical protein